MPPHHQGNAKVQVGRRSRRPILPRTRVQRPNRLKFALRLSKSRPNSRRNCIPRGKVRVRTTSSAVSAVDLRDVWSAVRHLRARAVLRDPLRVLRLQHLHAGRTRWREPRRLACGAARRAAVGGAARLGPRVVDTRVRRRWHPVAARRGSGWRRCSTRYATTSLLGPDAEVTTEANPESTSPELFDGLRAAGFTRVSLGMQSVAPHVLAVLDRVHSPGRAIAAAARGARRGLRPRQSRSDLRHARGDRRRSGALGRRGRRRRGRPRVRVRAGGRGRHRAGAPGAVAARSPPPTMTCSRTATS